MRLVTVFAAVLLLAGCGSSNGNNPNGPITGAPPTLPPVGPGGANPVGESRYLYTVSRLGKDILGYRVDRTSGRLAPVSATPLDSPTSVFDTVLQVAGSRVFLADRQANTITTYNIQADGRLLPIQASLKLNTTAQWTGLVATPNGQFLYAIGRNPNQLFTLSIDSSTGQLKQVGAPLSLPGGVPDRENPAVIDPSGTHLLVLSGNQVVVLGIQPDGSLISQGSVAAGTAPGQLTFDRSGSFVYVTDPALSVIHQFQWNAGGLQPLNPPNVSAGPGCLALAADPASPFLYCGNQDGSLSSFQINNGLLTQLGSNLTLPGYSDILSLKVDASGRSLYLHAQLVGFGSPSHILHHLPIQGDGQLGAVNDADAVLADAGGSIGLSTGSQSVSVVPLATYVVNQNSSTISAYQVGSGGKLSLLDEVATAGSGPTSGAVATLPNGAHVFYATTSTGVSIHAVGSDGHLGNGVSYYLAPTDHPVSTVVDPTQRVLYVLNSPPGANGFVTVMNIEDDGSLTGFATVDSGFRQARRLVADSRGGALYALHAQTISLLYADTRNRLVFNQGYSIPAAGGPLGGAFNSHLGQLGVASFASSSLDFFQHVALGALTVAGLSTPTGVAPRSVAFDPLGRQAYLAIDGALPHVASYSVDPSPVRLPGFPSSGTNPWAVACDPSGQFVYAANNNAGGAGSVSQYAIQADGSLAPLTPPSQTAGNGPVDVVTLGVTQ